MTKAEYFKKALNGGFSEAGSQSIDLPEEDPNIFRYATFLHDDTSRRKRESGIRLRKLVSKLSSVFGFYKCASLDQQHLEISSAGGANTVTAS